MEKTKVKTMGIQPTPKPKKPVSLLKALNPKPWYKRKLKINVRINAYRRNRIKRNDGLYSTEEIRKARETISRFLYAHQFTHISKTLVREEKFLKGFSKAEQKLLELAKKAQNEPTRKNQWLAIDLYSSLLKELDGFIRLRSAVHKYELSRLVAEDDSARSFVNLTENASKIETLKKIKEGLEREYPLLNIR
ncbi:MAG: hypothetical protein V1777_04695 [Candidatus Micrarchaeota archaeon]